jgi:hypothetical protein
VLDAAEHAIARTRAPIYIGVPGTMYGRGLPSVDGRLTTGSGPSCRYTIYCYA